jgi:glutamyl-tRNA synthetase
MTNLPPARVRYAPSPTGDPHVGNIRTAVWSWLYARHTGGQFIVRLEDTDQSRAVPGSLERILDALRWLGLDWDEGPDIGGPHAPYIQSQRLPLYQEAAQRLVAEGNAYPCFCSAEELDAMRKRQQAERRPPGYEGKCRALPRDQAAQRVASGEPHVLRFAVPREGSVTFDDMLRGPITVENRTLDDFVILKSDGFPTYHLAHIIDDHAMRITHVTRGDEWLPSAPRHALLWDALGYPRPVFFHNPVILAPGGGKLSKRHGAKFVLEYAEEGYLPDALINFLCITGWGHGDETFFTREQLIELFDIADVSVAPATFDHEKLTWLNGVHLRQLPDDELSELIARQLERDLPAHIPRPLDRVFVEELTPLVRERIELLSQVTPLVDFFFEYEIPTPPVEDFLVRGWKDNSEGVAVALDAAIDATEDLEPWEAERLEGALRATAEAQGVKAGELFTPIRLAVTGRTVAPPLFESMELIGEELCIERLRAAVRALRGEDDDDEWMRP